jgi:hypothetical protein
MAEDYKVGRGRPPRDRQWKKGGPSPHPQGRPKGSLSIKAAIERAVMAPCVVTVGTKRRRLPNVEAKVLSWFARSFKDDKIAETQVGDLVRFLLSSGGGHDGGAASKGEPSGRETLSDQDIIDAWEADLLERNKRIGGEDDE